ncbi:PKD domain-containing protein [Adhaeribacter soli]|uniref:PKD domain-containing protein n=1 Tax=Adhaeribacter soli TaxID=2607655 RepID=A0A5N1J819_9BACT|nr:PKD domain-containing protein [Adhaeribacter soli]KAA9346122.1 PKD domain-containing protein [Adhaeribacter soli]
MVSTVKTNIRFLFLFLFTLGFAACKSNHSDEPEPVVELPPASLATADFSTTIQLADIKQTVTFINKSANATRYTWYFGDGDSANTNQGKHKYNYPGKYTVKLKAYDNKGVPSVKALPIVVGERYVNELVINKLKFTDPAGNPWDQGSGPDVWLGFIKLSLENYMPSFKLKNNITPASLPLSLTFVANPFLNEDYKFALYEFDSVTTDQYTSRLMTSWIFNPVQATQWDSVNNTGFVELKNQDYEIRFILNLK